MADITCPNCGAEQYICHQGAYGQVENGQYQQECGVCEQIYSYGFRAFIPGDVEAAASQSSNNKLVIYHGFLAEKHQGMKISATGILIRVRGYLKPGAAELLRHLKEMSARFYDGDIKSVDEFLQLYCLDDDRPG